MRVTVVADLGGAARVVRSLRVLRDEGAMAPIAVVAEPSCAEDGAHLGLRSRTIAAGPSGETRLDLVDALRALGARRSPPDAVVVAVTARRILDTVQTVLEEPVVRRACMLDAVVAAVGAPRFSTRIATGAPLLGDDERVAMGIADCVAVAHSERLTPDSRAGVLAGIAEAAPHTPILVPALAPVTADRILGLDAWVGLHRYSRFEGPATPQAVTLRAHVPLGPRAVDEWSDVLRDELGSDLWRLQGRVVLRGERRAIDCIGMRSFANGSSGRDHGGAPISTVTIVGRDLPADRIVSAFRSTVTD